MSLLSLGAMVLWGMALCFGYQLFLPLAEKARSAPGTFLFYGCAGFLCFVFTGLFLYAVNGGEWGLYGFFAMLLGFWLYYSFFRARGRRFSLAAERFVLRLAGNGLRLSRMVANGVMTPFGKIVDKGVSWTEKRKSRKEKEDHGDMP